MKSFLLLSLLFLAMLPALASAEVRLLTGNANNQVHGSGSEIRDISADGDLVLFTTGPTSIGITKGGVYLRQLSTDTLTYVAGDTGSYIGVADAVLSDNGRYVAWRSTTKNFPESAPNPVHIYWRDRTANVTRLLTTTAEKPCVQPRISADGRYVTFVSAARNLPVAAGTLSTTIDRLSIFRYDSQADSLAVVSLAPDGSALAKGVGTYASVDCYDLSADGKYVVYNTESANAHPNQAAGVHYVYRRNLATGAVNLLNRNSSGAVVNGGFTNPRTNATGSRTAFIGTFIWVAPLMSNSVPASFGSDLYVKDSTSDSGEVWWASKTTTGVAHDESFDTTLSIDAAGDVVAFGSTSNILTAENSDAGGGHSGTFDIFRSDLGASGAVTVSLITKSPTNSGNVSNRTGPILSGTGSYVAFSTDQMIPMIGVASVYQGLGVGTFPSGPSTGLSYQEWSAALPVADRGYNDNPAGDGVSNLTKFMMGMNPAVPDRSQLPVEGSRSGIELGLAGDAELYFTFEFRIRRDLPTGFTWAVRAANDLANLSAGSGAAVQVGTPTADGDFDRYLFRFFTAKSALPGKGFMDLILTSAP